MRRYSIRCQIFCSRVVSLTGREGLKDEFQPHFTCLFSGLGVCKVPTGSGLAEAFLFYACATLAGLSRGIVVVRLLKH